MDDIAETSSESNWSEGGTETSLWQWQETTFSELLLLYLLSL